VDTRHKITDRQERAPGGKSAAREEVAIKADTTVMIADAYGRCGRALPRMTARK
jgi:hypothetical protein